MKCKNIIYSTTRQWNPGDEFILFGIKNILSKILLENNSIIYNRNPQIRFNLEYFNHTKKNKLNNFLAKIVCRLYQKISCFFDNSVKPDDNIKYVDIIIFAGSPEWRGERLEELYEKALKYKIPTLFLGIGAATEINLNDFSENEKKLLSLAKLVVTRDEYCHKSLLKFNSYFLPCPALFSSLNNKKIESVKRIGLMYGTYKSIENNNISNSTYNFITNLYKKLILKFKNKYEFEFIAHYIDELPAFYDEYNDQNIKYSYDAKDYLNIYSKYDLVIGHRVHGIGMAASLGIPGIVFSHDKRSDTAKGFLADFVTLDSSEEKFFSILNEVINNISAKSENLISHKIETEKKYLDLLKNNICI